MESELPRNPALCIAETVSSNFKTTLTKNDMKKALKLLTLSSLVILYSCSIEKHIIENNTLTKKQVEKIDSIFVAIDTISRSFNGHISSFNPPNFDILRVVPIEVFYFGEIVKEEIVEKNNGWLKLKLTEKIKLQNNQTIEKEKYGWFSYQSPNKIYLVNSNEILQELSSSDISTNIDLKNYLLAPLVTTKDETLDQKTIDMLLSQKAMNFDGLKFNKKRFDYSNFSLGSFRGTYFIDCDLSNVIATREFLTNDNDFFKTRIDVGTNKDMTFKYWKFSDVIFFNTKIENSTFENCIFMTASTTGLVSFNNAIILNTKFSNPNDGYFSNIVHNNSSFQNCKFENVKSYGSINFNTKIEKSDFFNCLWQNSSYSSNSKIIGGYFFNHKIINGNFSYFKIESLGQVKPKFESCEFTNSIFSNSTINAWFAQNTSFSGLTNFSNINFTSSIFEQVTFGSPNQGVPFNMKNCNFGNVEFRNQVKFIKCDLTGCIWPSDISNVQFIDCIGVN